MWHVAPIIRAIRSSLRQLRRVENKTINTRPVDNSGKIRNPRRRRRIPALYGAVEKLCRHGGGQLGSALWTGLCGSGAIQGNLGGPQLERDVVARVQDDADGEEADEDDQYPGELVRSGAPGGAAGLFVGVPLGRLLHGDEVSVPRLLRCHDGRAAGRAPHWLMSGQKRRWAAANVASRFQRRHGKIVAWRGVAGVLDVFCSSIAGA